MITGMTGGVEKGAEINKRLALCAQKFKIPMGVGSQRMALENPSYEKIFKVKHHAPDLFLVANIGAAQIKDYKQCGFPDAGTMARRLIEMIDADALAIHVNILQELIQVEGDRDFRGIFQLIEDVCKSVSTPIVVKEVGCGVDPQTASKLSAAGVAAIDVGGKGGTSWSRIEGLRSTGSNTNRVADTFRNWGIPTAVCLSLTKSVNCELTATGGVRTGLDVAKIIALGAKCAGLGLPLFRAAIDSSEALDETMATIVRELKTAMMVTGAKNLADLSKVIGYSQEFHHQRQKFLPSQNIENARIVHDEQR